MMSGIFCDRPYFIFASKKINHMNGIIRKLGVIWFFSLITLGVNAQENAATAPDNSAANTDATIADLPLKPLRLPSLAEVGGSIFMTPDFNLAVVQLSNGTTVRNVPVKFNIFNNVVVVQRDGQELKLESFDLIDYIHTSAGTEKHVLLSQGYPDIDNHSPATIYQVLAKGPKIHLLKFLTQKVEDAPSLGEYSRRELVTSHQLYVYFSGGEIKKISTGKKAVSEVLSQWSATIEEIVKAKSLNLKSENDLALLVEELNKN
jgi:hypothetical protein